MQEKIRFLALVFYRLPRVHRIMLCSLTALTLIVSLWRPNRLPLSNNMVPVSRSIELNLSSNEQLSPMASEPVDQTSSSPAEEMPEDENDNQVAAVPGLHEYIISSGDTLGSALNQYDIDTKNIAALAKSDSELRNLKPGQKIAWTIDDDGDIKRLTWEVSRRETRIYQVNPAGGFKMNKQIRHGEWQNSVVKGEIKGSFAASAQRAGLSSSEVREVMQAIQWQMDFRKLHNGDTFTALVSREMLDGKRQQSQLLGVRVNANGKSYYAFRANDSKFYDRSGVGLAHGFLRFPTARKWKVSSNFSPRRLNPVTGRVSPHNGVDFTMPIGTPVLSVGDGEVVVAKNGGASGNYVTIRHGRQYTTRYMHLNKILVTAGQKVKRGDRIALSGNTGRSTGPHLHYEIWVNNQAVNPLTANLPRTEGLTGKARSQYLIASRNWLSLLKSTD